MKKTTFTRWLPLVVLSIVYVVTHLPSLTLLPVFADESIYIRWSQLLINDPGRYFFFAMNDGKTPLFIWLMAPLQLLTADQLWLGRVVSVAIGLCQMGATGWLVKVIGGRPKTIWLSMLLVSILPFWYFHHRVALIDGLLALTLTLAWVGVIQLARQQHQRLLWILWTGVWLGLALWSKVPAVLAFPALVTSGLYIKKLTRTTFLQLFFSIGASIFIALILFASLRVSPAFGQLFSRGSDFLYPVGEIWNGAWKQTLPNIPTYVSYFGQYFGYPLLVLILVSLFIPRHKKHVHALWWSALIFAVPMMVMGRVVFPRYFLPMMVWLTPAVALAAEAWWAHWINPEQDSPHPNLAKLGVSGLILLSLLGQSIASAGVFMASALFDVDHLPLVSADQTQYLGEWSSGHGIPETIQLIEQLRQRGSVAVATEGSFGTLPDGLLLYYFHRPVSNLYIEGIGQPVHLLDEAFITRARDFDHVLLVVNSHRMNMTLPPESKLLEVCRPIGDYCLQVWDVTTLAKTQ